MILWTFSHCRCHIAQRVVRTLQTVSFLTQVIFSFKPCYNILCTDIYICRLSVFYNCVILASTNHEDLIQTVELLVLQFKKKIKLSCMCVAMYSLFPLLYFCIYFLLFSVCYRPSFESLIKSLFNLDTHWVRLLQSVNSFSTGYYVTVVHLDLVNEVIICIWFPSNCCSRDISSNLNLTKLDWNFVYMQIVDY